MRMIVEQLVEWRVAGETEVLGENLPQRHFVHHKSHMTRPGLKPRAAVVGSQRLTAWAMARPPWHSLQVQAILDMVIQIKIPVFLLEIKPKPSSM
jgi:hypothetical protein